MPHAGLINNKMKKVDAQLLRARLHYRGGKLRLERGDTDHGIAALYDALLSAMIRCTLNTNLSLSSDISKSDSETNEKNLFFSIKKIGLIDNSFNTRDFEYIARVTEDALNFCTSQKDIPGFMKRIENILSQLDVLPLNETELPPVDSQII